MLNGKTGGAGGINLLRNIDSKIQRGGCDKGGVECQESYCLVRNPRINKRMSCKGQTLTDSLTYVVNEDVSLSDALVD